MGENSEVANYPRKFFESLKKGARSSARQIVPIVMNLVEPRSVVDVGCGTGVWLNAFRDNGVNHLLGIDHLTKSDVLEIPKSEFMDFDLCLPLRLDRKFDLVVSLEVAEHLPKDSAEVFVESLVSLGEVVLFSAAIPYQQGFHHVNEQWPEYWAELFAAKGFIPVDCIRARVWRNESVEPFYSQNTLLYATHSALADHSRLRDAWGGKPRASACNHTPENLCFELYRTSRRPTSVTIGQNGGCPAYPAHEGRGEKTIQT